MVSVVEESHIERQKQSAKVAMIFVLVSFSMLFATLLLGHVAYRLTADQWPPMGMPKVPLTFPILSTGLIFVSGFFLWRYQKSLKMGELLATVIFGFFFLVSQGLFWGQLNELGIYVRTGIFASLLHGLTWIHAAHLVGGLVLLLWAVGQRFRYGRKVDWPRLTGRDQIFLMCTAQFWHFLGIVWLVMVGPLFFW